MNFVAEILTSAAKVETENLNKKIPDILSAILGFKRDVLQYCDKIYIKFSERPKSNVLLFKKASELTKNISEIENSINNVRSNDVSEMKTKIMNYKEELEEARCALQIASTLINIHEILINMKNSLQQKNYLEGIKQIQEVNQILDSTSNRYITEIEAFDGLIDKQNEIQSGLISELNKEFNDCVQYNKNKPFTLTIKKGSDVETIVMAMGLAHVKIDLLDELTAFLWEFILGPIISNKTSIDVTESNDISQLALNIIDENKKEGYKDVFNNLLSVFNFLYINFNYSLGTNISTLGYIGSLINDKLSELIIKDCLSIIVPKNSEDFHNYKKIIEDAESLQKELIKYEILSDEMDAIIKYVHNVEICFIDNKCQNYITVARDIMKKDLHDMVEAGTHDDTNSLTSPSNIFPHCFISRSTLELIELSLKIMQSAKAYENNAERLYSTMLHIFDIYGEVVQNHHQKLLQTIPQQVALFHNNCMFLSYKLSTSIEAYILPAVNISDSTLLIEKSHLLRHVGNTAFVDCLEQHIKQIEDIMKESGLSSVSVLEKLDPITEKSIRQCLRQQELLRTVWHKVLSHVDYNRSIGCILNFLCNFIINETLKIEDVSSEVGDQLVDIFKVILTRGPKLFIDSKDIHLFVKSWYRFNELVFVLGSSLTEICDRWADNKGPLALQFKPEEVQKLIRALFQNSSRRAAVLAKIVK